MNSILIEAAHFSQAQALRDLIARRMLDVGMLEDTVAPDAGATLVFSAAHEAALGNMQALLAVAREMKPRLVVIVDDSADHFSITSDLGGKVKRVNLPQSDGLALTVAADIICADLAKMIAADPATTDLLALANRVAKSDVTVFINGPTGTGKEVLARFIHDRSDRAKEPFVAINCAAIPENMLEAVLFGHEKGAFTGASVANKGIFRAADKGTLLLDEISEMPLGLQSKLLRVLQERKVTPLGAQGEIDVNLRVLATTNRDMRAEVAANRFREDLFYRLNVFPMATQALRSRPEDILPVAVALLRKHSMSLEVFPWLSDGACDVLCNHDWPGNVRELENVMQRALVLQNGGVVQAEDIVIDTVPMLQSFPTPQSSQPTVSRLSAYGG